MSSAIACALLAACLCGCVETKRTERMSAFGSHAPGEKTTSSRIPTYQAGDARAIQNGGR